MEKKNTFLPALTGYRAIAAWLIFIFHLLKPNTKWQPWLQSIVGQFHIGVDMFFVLSGFLIAYRYYDENPINLKKFFTNRVARIYPMYFLLTIAFFTVTYLESGWNPERTIEAALSFTLTKALFEKYTFVGIDTGWTLTIEEIFYLFAPLFFILIRKKKIFLYLLPVFIFLFGSGLKFIFKSSEWGFMQNNIAVYVFEFFAGIFLALYFKRKNLSYKGIATYFGLFFMAAYLCFHAFIAGRLTNDWYHSVDVIVLSFCGILPLMYGLIFEKTIISKILSLPLMILLGKSSYIFYLIHKGFVTNYLYKYISENVIVIFILLNIISVLLFTFVEEPLNIYIRNRFKNYAAKI